MITKSLTVQRWSTEAGTLRAWVAIAALAGGTFLASAQIVEYPINSSLGSATTMNAINVNANITASQLQLVGVPVSSFSQTMAGQGSWPLGAYNSGKYFQFSVTPNSGYAVSYSSLTYALFRTLITPSSDISSWSLHASTDGFSSSDITLDNVSLSGSGLTEQVTFNSNVSALGTQAGTVTFRLYGKDNGASGGGLAGLANRVSFAGTGSNVLLGGSVSPVPEVEHMAFAAGVGLLAFAAIRRRTA